MAISGNELVVGAISVRYVCLIDPATGAAYSAGGSGTGASAGQVQGAGASAAAAVGNPVGVGAIYNSAAPTYTNGQRTDLQADARGSLKVSFALSDGTISAADANGLVLQGSLTSARWQYAAATGGITNTTTAVTLAAAAGASFRNYCSSLQLASDALGAATEIAVRDGAGGTVLWRGKVSTAGVNGIQSIRFDPPLKGTANTLMEIATLTATLTGGVYVNAQGFTGI